MSDVPLTKEQLEARDKWIDSLGGVKLTSVLVEMYGLTHALTLIGFAIRWGVAGFENGPEFRAFLKSQGVSRATAYRAALDWRRFGEELEKRYGVQFPNETLVQGVKQSELGEYCLADMRRDVVNS